jgi:ABC-type dipeptide/oligopeptide/nickel transport system permease subunit
MAFLLSVMLACIGSLPWTLGSPGRGGPAGGSAEPRYNAGQTRDALLPPAWWPVRSQIDARRFNGLVASEAAAAIADRGGLATATAISKTDGPVARELARHWPNRLHPWWFLLGSDALGRSLFIRCLTGGGISLTIGLAAATLSVFIGTVYGSLAGYLGGKADAVMMRVVDVLYGLPYILLVVLLAVAVQAATERVMMRRVESATLARKQYVQSGLAGATGPAAEARREALEAEAVRRFGTGELSNGKQNAINVIVLLIAIGGVSWLTMARVVRGQVLSLKNQPFMEAARAIGVGWSGQFTRHLLPNLGGTIIVYATLTVPQAILQESFLSFLGIGVRPPLPSWGNLAAEGLSELNTYKSYWWLLVFPCILLGSTLLALNFVGEGLREALDPRRNR